MPSSIRVSSSTTAELDPRYLLASLNAFRRRDFSARLPEEWTGVAGKVADAFNDVVELNQRMAAELEWWTSSDRSLRKSHAWRVRSVPKATWAVRPTCPESAMKHDREKCIEAGASDYMAKRVEAEHLLSRLRAWLCR